MKTTQPYMHALVAGCPAAHDGEVNEPGMRNMQLTVLLLFMFVKLCALPVLGQEKSGDPLSRLRAYQGQHYAEKIYLSTDQHRYFTGEQLWCSLIVTDASLHRPSTLSKLAYVELLDARGRLAWQTMVRLDSGRGQFSWTIPGSLATGNYLLRAYTRWMRNQGPESFFRTTIALLNPAKKPTADGQEKRQERIWASAEGGTLIDGIPARIHYFCPPCALAVGRLQVMNDQGKELAASITPSSRSGQVRFTPVSGSNYYLQWQSPDGKTIRSDLPPVAATGISLEVSRHAEDGADLIVRKQPGAPAQELQLFSHCRGYQASRRSIQLDRDSLFIHLDRKTLGEGMNQLLLMNTVGEILASSICYLEPRNPVPLSISDLPRTTGKRNDVSVRVSLGDGNHSPALISARVVRAEDSLAQGGQSLQDYLYFGAESPQPGGFGQPGTDAREALSAMLAIAASHPLRWQSVLESQRNAPPILPDYSGPGIEVLVSDKNSGQPAAGREVMLTVPGTRFQASMGKTGQDGIARFLLDQREGSGELVFSLLGADREQLVLTPIRSFDSTRTVYDQVDPVFAKTTIDAFSAELVDAQLQQAIGASSKGALLAWSPDDTTAFFGKPDREYALDDYVRFNTLEEVFREYVREVEVRKNRNDYRLLVVNLPMRAVFQEDPLVLVDGVPFRDMNQVMRIDPKKINRIAIVARRFQLGGLSFPGIISMRTYSGHMEGIELPQDLLIEDYAGLLAAYQFETPNPQQASRQPDLRRTLFWMPFQKIDSLGSATLRFRTGDLGGKYALVLEALGADGRASRQVHYFQVQ